MGMLAAGAPAASRQLAPGATAMGGAPPAQLAAGAEAKSADADLIAEIEGLGGNQPS
jgi:hypothetical protein